jgi:tRNA G18 (ribose-2'-O)-methylase SpoU
MTASKDKTSGDFDLPSFKPSQRHETGKSNQAAKAKAPSSEGGEAAERKPRAYRTARPAYGEGGKDAPARKPYAPRSEGPRTLKGEFPSKPAAWQNRDPAAVERPRPNEFKDRTPRSDKPSYGDRPKRDFGDRPARPYGDKPAYGGGDSRPPRKAYGDKPAYGDRPARPYGDKPAYGGGDSRPPRKAYGDKPSYGDRPKPAYGDRPARPYGDKPAYGGGDSRPPRKAYGDKPAYGDRPKRDFGDRPTRSYGDRPSAYGDGPKPFQSELSPEIKKFLHLTTEKGRYKDSRFLIEGAKNVADVVELSPDILHIVLVADTFQDETLKAAVKEKKIRTSVVAASDLSALCGTETPQGIVAVANLGALRPDWARINTVTLLDGVQDPGNLGAILRTCAALGMDAVVLGKGTCDPYNPKVVRSSAASLLRLPLETGEDLATKIHFLRTKGFTIVATSPHAKVTLETAKLRKKVALLFGNEGGGVGENLIDQADATVRIPMKGKVESLNVAVAHGLLTYDLMRLRA